VKSKACVVVALLSLAMCACGARSQLDLPQGFDAGPLPGTGFEAGPRPQGCRFEKPTQIADIAFGGGKFSAEMQVSALTPANGTLYVGAWIEDGEYNGDGYIASAPTTGGSLHYVTGDPSNTANLLHYVGGNVVQNETSLYYPHPTFIGDYAIEVLDVARRSLATGKEDLLPKPAGISGSLTVLAIAEWDPGIIWLTVDNDTSIGRLFHWDGTTTTELAVTESYWPSGLPLAVTNTTAYIASSSELIAVPLYGSGAQIVQTWEDGKGALLAANATSVFYTLDGSTILQSDETLGVVNTIATGVHARYAAANLESLYVMTMTDIVRVSLRGEPTVTITSSPTLNALGVDECNVYWGVMKPDFSGDQLVMALGTNAR
jgi:hypothetical protein